MVANRDRDQQEEDLAPEDFDDDEIEEIIDFCSKTGGLMLVSELYEHPKRFVTLVEEINVSSATIRNRIEDARELRLIYGEDNPKYNENAKKVHPLTVKGEVIAAKIQVTDLARIQQEIWDLEDEFDEQLGEFESDLKDERSELNEHLKDLVEKSF